MNRFDLKTYARAGAAARLAEIEQERRAILSAFPDLRSRNAPGRARAVSAAAAGTRKTRKRRPLSPEARKKMSEAAKKRWAAKQ